VLKPAEKISCEMWIIRLQVRLVLAKASWLQFCKLIA